jgi:hypothetical protein
MVNCLLRIKQRRSNVFEEEEEEEATGDRRNGLFALVQKSP